MLGTEAAFERPVCWGTRVGAFLLPMLCVGCGPIPAESEQPRAQPPRLEPAPEAAPRAPAAARTSCGDFSCGFEESCGSCAADCGSCLAAIDLLFTEPLADATVARSEATIGPVESALLRDLDAAEESIWIAIYGFSRQNLARSLERAASRGVDVRLVTECEERTGAQAELLATLEASGASVRDDGSSFEGLSAGCPQPGGTMHHKFLVVDRRLVWVGSANLTVTDLNYNHNHLVRIEDSRVASVFAAEWEELWSGRYGKAKSARPAERVEVGGAEIEVGFSPRLRADGDSVTRTLALEALALAESSIEFALFALTDGSVAEELGRRPSLLRGLVDATLAGQSSSKSVELCGLGAALWVENLPGKVHHKLGVVDAGGPRAAVLGGSANWSGSGFDANDETLLVVHDRALATRAAAEIERLIEDPAHAGGACCFHAAEAYDAGSATCDGWPCVCINGLDDDFDGLIDEADAGCSAPFACAD